MRQSEFSSNSPVTYTAVEYVLPEGTFTNGVVRATPPVPHECPGCGSQETDPNPAVLIDDIYLDCPRCGSSARPEDDDLNSDARLSADVRDILAEEASRGTGRPSSNGGSSRKKRNGNQGRMTVRFEQEVAALLNGQSGETIRVKRLETASERFELQLTLDCRERLREVAHDKRNEHREAYPQVQLVRDSLRLALHLDNPREIERGTPRTQMQMRLFPSELLLIDRAAEYWKLSRHQVVEACLWEYLKE